MWHDTFWTINNSRNFTNYFNKNCWWRKLHNQLVFHEYVERRILFLMAITRKKNLGLLLIEAGIIEPEQLEQALLKQAKEANSGYIGDILISAGLIDEKTRNRFLSQQLHIPSVELGHFEVEKSVLGMIPERIVREYNVLPIFNLNNTINVAITDPIDPEPCLLYTSPSPRDPT